MRKLAILFSALCLVGMLGGAAWAWNAAPLDLLVAPNATELHVAHTGMAEQVVVYRAAGEEYAWRVAIERNLQQHGWTNPQWWRPDRSVVSYISGTRVGIGLIWMQVDLAGEPHIARITVRRWLEIAWPQYWRWRTTLVRWSRLEE